MATARRWRSWSSSTTEPPGALPLAGGIRRNRLRRFPVSRGRKSHRPGMPGSGSLETRRRPDPGSRRGSDGCRGSRQRSGRPLRRNLDAADGEIGGSGFPAFAKRSCGEAGGGCRGRVSRPVRRDEKDVSLRRSQSNRAVGASGALLAPRAATAERGRHAGGGGRADREPRLRGVRDGSRAERKHGAARGSNRGSHAARLRPDRRDGKRVSAAAGSVVCRNAPSGGAREAGSFGGSRDTRESGAGQMSRRSAGARPLPGAGGL